MRRSGVRIPLPPFCRNGVTQNSGGHFGSLGRAIPLPPFCRNGVTQNSGGTSDRSGEQSPYLHFVETEEHKTPGALRIARESNPLTSTNSAQQSLRLAGKPGRRTVALEKFAGERPIGVCAGAA